MTRHASIDRGKLADTLVDVVDNIRRKVHGSLGTRTYRVQVITRRWSGGTVGEGRPIVTVLELDPRPLVERVERDRLGPGGREAAGDVVITEVSLRYSAEELQPPTPPGTEIAYRAIDTGGQRQPDQWFVIGADPVSRRGDRKGDKTDWRVYLKQSTPMADFDGADQ